MLTANTPTTGKITFKNAQAFFIENEKLRVIITVRGSKMVSLYDKKTGKEFLLQSKNDPLRQGEFDSDYNAVDVCGFDEMLPAIDALYYEQAPWQGVKIADHGEVWSLDWDCAENGTSLEAGVCGVRFPYLFSKTITFKNSNTLRIDYSLKNNSPFDMDYVWAAHAMFSLDNDSVIILPGEKMKTVLTHSYQNKIGHYGDELTIEDGDIIYRKNKVKMQIPNEIYMNKFYITDPLPRGCCGVYYPDVDRTCMMEFSTDKTPYLGVLAGNGLHIGNCVILEPCSGAFDRPDRARSHNMNSVLKAKENFKWYLEITVAEGRIK